MTPPRRARSGSAYTCPNCGKRQGRILWGDALAVTHGGTLLRCGVCVYGPQLAHAVKRAAVIPALAGKLIWAWVRQS